MKKAKRAAKVDPGQGVLLPSSPPVVTPRELPVRFQVDLTPEQEARRSALVETREMEIADEADAMTKPHKTAQSGTPGEVFSSRPPVQIHVHEDAKTGRMTVQTDAGERELSKAESERMRCDAAVCEHGGRNTTTIPLRVRREVLARDQHRCQATGCGMSGEEEFNSGAPLDCGSSYGGIPRQPRENSSETQFQGHNLKYTVFHVRFFQKPTKHGICSRKTDLGSKKLIFYGMLTEGLRYDTIMKVVDRFLAQGYGNSIPACTCDLRRRVNFIFFPGGDPCEPC